MAELPPAKLNFRGQCPDCGEREVRLPNPLSVVGDDFDWRVRDYDGFRMFMLEELAARFPERTRWTPADLEVVLVEVLATLLDQLSDMLDRVAAEAYLESARRPETVYQLLEFIGYQALEEAQARGEVKSTLSEEEAVKTLLDFWRTNPYAMEREKRAGPREIHTQKRMVTLEDYAVRLREHPLVLNAHARQVWTGSWYSISLAVIIWGYRGLDQEDDDTSNLIYDNELIQKIIRFHRKKNIPFPSISLAKPPSIRMILRPYIDSFRMVGQEVILEAPQYVGIYLSLSVHLSQNYFQSEMRYAIAQVLGSGPEGFFEAGHMGFGVDLYVSDLKEALMKLDGIENVCLNRFKRLGSQYPDRTKEGYIPLDGLEVAVCSNDNKLPHMGYYRLKLHGGRKG